MQVSVEYHHEPEGWWGEVKESGWTNTLVAGVTLKECRDRMRELLPFAVDERLTARSVMFWSVEGPNPAKLTPEACETFELFVDERRDDS